MSAIDEIKSTLAGNPIVLFMKGTPEFPQCGFSMRTAQALKACNVKFAYVDVLANPHIRADLPKVSNWPTFPQVFVNGELIGGCDITLELYRTGELQPLLTRAAGGTSGDGS
ncbi:MAG: Grx4 family monothiol glutaredoxin [Gammaproteobacteria bacterium]|nr:Grx4 family monothiol glutaredoxin [Gammaproteobacteria bacterium]